MRRHRREDDGRRRDGDVRQCPGRARRGRSTPHPGAAVGVRWRRIVPARRRQHRRSRSRWRRLVGCGGDRGQPSLRRGARRHRVGRGRDRATQPWPLRPRAPRGRRACAARLRHPAGDLRARRPGRRSHPAGRTGSRRGHAPRRAHGRAATPDLPARHGGRGRLSDRVRGRRAGRRQEPSGGCGGRGGGGARLHRAARTLRRRAGCALPAGRGRLRTVVVRLPGCRAGSIRRRWRRPREPLARAGVETGR